MRYVCLSRGLGVVYKRQHLLFFFFQAEDGIRDRSPSRGLGDVYKRQIITYTNASRNAFWSSYTATAPAFHISSAPPNP